MLTQVFDLTSAISARVYPAGSASAPSSAPPETSFSSSPGAFVSAASVFGVGHAAAAGPRKAPLTKTRSLEKDYEFRVRPKQQSVRAQQQQQQQQQPGAATTTAASAVGLQQGGDAAPDALS